MNIQKITDKALVKRISTHKSDIDERRRRIKLYGDDDITQIEIALRLNISTREITRLKSGK